MICYCVKIIQWYGFEAAAFAIKVEATNSLAECKMPPHIRTFIEAPLFFVVNVDYDFQMPEM